MAHGKPGTLEEKSTDGNQEGSQYHRDPDEKLHLEHRVDSRPGEVPFQEIKHRCEGQDSESKNSRTALSEGKGKDSARAAPVPVILRI